MTTKPLLLPLFALLVCSGCASVRKPVPAHVVPGNVQSMFTHGRSVAAQSYARDEDSLMLNRVFFPMSPILTNDTSYRVTYVDTSTWRITTNGANLVTSYEDVSLRIQPDGRLEPAGVSVNTQSEPVRPPRTSRATTNEPITRLPDLNYVALAMDALPADVDPEKRSRIMPYSCEVLYRKNGDPASGMKYVWVSLFDPMDIEKGKDIHNYQVSGYGILVKFDKTAIFRSRARFGSTRFSEIYEQRIP